MHLIYSLDSHELSGPRLETCAFGNVVFFEFRNLQATLDVISRKSPAYVV
jgi:hypothetical protein